MMNCLRTPHSALTNELPSPNIRSRRLFGWARADKSKGREYGGFKSVAKVRDVRVLLVNTEALSTLELKYCQY
jgi:hypothetical protein